MTNIFCIGGSPCSGKSTVAEMMAGKVGECDYINLMIWVLTTHISLHF